MRLYILLFGTVFGISSTAFAKERTPDQQLRHNYMEAIGGHMGSIGTIMKNKMNNPKLISAHAAAIAAVNSHLLEMFPKGSEGGDAKPEIWTKWADFEKKYQAFKLASDELNTSAQTGDMSKIGPAVGKMGESCKGCHEIYKKSDKKKK